MRDGHVHGNMLGVIFLLVIEREVGGGLRSKFAWEKRLEENKLGI